MLSQTIEQIIAEKRKTLAAKLVELTPHWPVSERRNWCLHNDLSEDRIKRSYLKGTVSIIPVAEKLIEAMEAYIKQNNIAA